MTMTAISRVASNPAVSLVLAQLVPALLPAVPMPAPAVAGAA